MRKTIIGLIFILIGISAKAQDDSLKWIPAPPLYYPFIEFNGNSISHLGKLDTIFKKLFKIQQLHKGRLNVIHIGDSHLQADMMTKILRTGLQEFFGDLGRGLIFPHQLANSNSPKDYTVSTNAVWKGARMGIDKTRNTGICGFEIQTNKENAYIKMHLKDIDEKSQYFNRMLFFLGTDSGSYRLTDSNLKRTVIVHTRPSIDTPSLTYDSDSLLSGFELTKTDVKENGDFAFYGVSLERKDTCGVLYHTIGVNGARLDHYIENDLFWHQLSALKGDLFIISLGTNEAQNTTINQPKILEMCEAIVKRIRVIAPKATILFTTPPGSFFRGKKPNNSVQTISQTIQHFCEVRDFPYWDLNRITNGTTGALGFKKYHLLAHDLVHFSLLGYQMQGYLFLNAIADAYNIYVKRHPPIVPKPKPKVVIEYSEKPKKNRK